jgi:predicted esterase
MKISPYTSGTIQPRIDLTISMAAPLRLLFLHGYDNAHPLTDAQQISRYLRMRTHHEIEVLAPVGPVRLALGGHAWWDDDLDTSGWNSLCAHMNERFEGTLDPVVLCAFSQGSAAALSWILHPNFNGPTFAAVSLAAPFLPDVVIEAMNSGLIGDLTTLPPIHLVAIEDDPVVDVMHSARAKRLLGAAGAQIQLDEIPGSEHQFSECALAVSDYLGGTYFNPNFNANEGTN